MVIVAITITACGDGKQPEQVAATATPVTAGAFVQLFEWRWLDVAKECESFLGPAGYAAVQISPPNEHVTGPAWWTRYQPVSYKIESRGGTRAEFVDMVGRCKDAGVDIYADAITNHMAGFDKGSGVAGSNYSEFSYPVPYDFDDFHHCGRYDDDRIRDYQDLWEIQNCQLGKLDDLDTGKPSVQGKIAAYLNDLLGLGVAGFRMDAVKHMAHDEVHAILQLVDGNPFVFQEVIDRGGEPINAMNYVRDGMVTEFKYPPIIVQAFEDGNLDALTNFWAQPGWLPADQAIVFVDNHDIQRGHAGSVDIVNYKDGALYDLAVAFMLAYPYGYPMVMSSYEFVDGDHGAPKSSPHDDAGGCGIEWVCEHRRPGIANMVEFRQATNGAEVIDWNIVDDTVLSFGLGDKGHIVINIGELPVTLKLETGLPAGDYVDIISSSNNAAVGENGLLAVNMAPQSAIALLNSPR